MVSPNCRDSLWIAGDLRWVLCRGYKSENPRTWYSTRPQIGRTSRKNYKGGRKRASFVNSDSLQWGWNNRKQFELHLRRPHRYIKDSCLGLKHYDAIPILDASFPDETFNFIYRRVKVLILISSYLFLNILLNLKLLTLNINLRSLIEGSAPLYKNAHVPAGVHFKGRGYLEIAPN